MDATGIPLVGSLATVSKDGRDLTLLVINRSLEAPVTAVIRLRDYKLQATAQVLAITASRIN